MAAKAEEILGALWKVGRACLGSRLAGHVCVCAPAGRLEAACVGACWQGALPCTHVLGGCASQPSTIAAVFTVLGGCPPQQNTVLGLLSCVQVNVLDIEKTLGAVVDAVLQVS